MVQINENGSLVIEVEQASGERLAEMQKALILGIECIGHSDGAGDKEYRNATFYLSEILRACMLTDSQTNVGLGGTPYKSHLKNAQNIAH